jgi:cytochrome b561
VAIALHWTIGGLILLNIGLAWTFLTLKPGLQEFRLIQLHKSVGVTVLVLSVARLVWRLANPPPRLVLPPWQAVLSQAVHWGFYGVMIGAPLSGWVMVSASKLNLPTLLYGAIPWPYVPFVHSLPPSTKAVWAQGASATHLALAWIAYGLIVLHVSGALKHQFLDRDNLIARMAPVLGAPKSREQSYGR